MADKQTDDSDRKTISFGFAKKIEKKSLEQSKVGDGSGLKEKEETDFVLSLEGKEVKSTKPKEETKDLVIPLITKNRWKLPTKDSSKCDRGDTATISDSLEKEAVQEIIEAASKQQEEWENRSKVDTSMEIPLLMRNQIPEGFETDDKLDTSLRPDEATEANYDEVPIEHYGMAMLRGMGWQPGEAIGGKFKKVSAPVEAVLRPKGLGLGADRRPGDENSKKKRIKPGDKRQEEEVKGFAKDVTVLVTSGPHKNLYGKIEGVDEDNSRLHIRLAISNQTATISQYAVNIVDKKEYKKYARDLSKFSKAHEDKNQESRDKHRRDEDKNQDGDKDRDKDRHRDRYRDEDKHRDRYRDEEKRKRDKYNTEERESYSEDRKTDRHHDRRKEDVSDAKKRRKYEDESIYRNSPTSSSKQGSDLYWLRPELRVRIIDQTYKKGRYYNTKVVIIDVVTRDMCSCKTDDGKLLEDLKQSMLETLIPKTAPLQVMIVNGKYKGQLGTILKKDKANCVAHVELLSDRNKIKKLEYDSICEYVGNIQDELDY